MAISTDPSGATTLFASALMTEPDTARYSHSLSGLAQRVSDHVTQAYAEAGLEAPADVVPDVSAFFEAARPSDREAIYRDALKALSMTPDQQRKHGARIRARLIESGDVGFQAVANVVSRAVFDHVLTAWHDSAEALTPAFMATVDRLGEIGAEIAEAGGPVQTLDPGLLGAGRRLDVLTHLAEIETLLRRLGRLTIGYRPAGQVTPHGYRHLIVSAAVPSNYGDLRAYGSNNTWPCDLALLGIAGGWWDTPAVWSISGDFPEGEAAAEATMLADGVAG